MKSISVGVLLLISINLYSQVVVGVIERKNPNGFRQDYYYEIAEANKAKNAPDWQLKKSMEERMKKHSQYNWALDAIYTFVGYQELLTIIKYKGVNAVKFGIGFGRDSKNSLENAKELIKAYFGINHVADYEVLYEGYYSTGQESSYDLENRTQIVCSVCKGNKKQFVEGYTRNCKKCNGKGYFMFGAVKTKCVYPLGYCNGTGKVTVKAHWEDCPNCSGKGFTYK